MGVVPIRCTVWQGRGRHNFVCLRGSKMGARG